VNSLLKLSGPQDNASHWKHVSLGQNHGMTGVFADNQIVDEMAYTSTGRAVLAQP
jgi:hypothetical protein